jgi:hypothetical protein
MVDRLSIKIKKKVESTHLKETKVLPVSLGKKNKCAKKVFYICTDHLYFDILILICLSYWIKTIKLE